MDKMLNTASSLPASYSYSSYQANNNPYHSVVSTRTRDTSTQSFFKLSGVKQTIISKMANLPWLIPFL